MPRQDKSGDVHYTEFIKNLYKLKSSNERTMQASGCKVSPGWVRGLPMSFAACTPFGGAFCLCLYAGIEMVRTAPEACGHLFQHLRPSSTLWRRTPSDLSTPNRLHSSGYRPSRTSFGPGHVTSVSEFKQMASLSLYIYVYIHTYVCIRILHTV